MPDQQGENAVSKALESQRLTWQAPKLIALDRLANAEKLSYNTEGGLASGLS